MDLARVAAVLAPYTPSVNGNHGLAAEAAAQHESGTDDIAGRNALLSEAAAAYTNAARQAPAANIYKTALDRVRRLILE